MRGHAAVARALRENGVETIFGLIGDGNMFYVLDFIEREQGAYVGAVAEGGAVSMADGYAKVSGKVGVASVTHGPGAANTVNALLESVKANTPLLLITADTPARRGDPQSIDIRALFGGTGAEVHRVMSSDHLVDDVALCLARTMATRKPIVLDIPIDIQNEDVDYQAQGLRGPEPQALRPDDDALDQALGILGSARRPLILAGRGAVLSGAGPALATLADLLGAPLATTASAKDMFNGHPYNLGIMGNYGLPWALDVMAKADCVAAFGAGLNRNTTVGGDLIRGRALIHCDVDPSTVTPYSPTAVSVLGDAKATAEAMVEQLREAGLEPQSFRTSQLGDGVLDQDPCTDFTDLSTRETLDVRTAMIELDRLLPKKRVVVTDGGRFMAVPWRYLHVEEARHFVHTVAWASIGLGVAGSVGAAVAEPDRLTVGVAGDGGAMMGIIELSTAVRHQVPLVMVIVNDGAYGAEFGKLEARGYSGKSSFVDWPDFAEVARSLGADGVTVRTVEELRQAASLTTDLHRPLLIDIRADPALDPRD